MLRRLVGRRILADKLQHMKSLSFILLFLVTTSSHAQLSTAQIDKIVDRTLKTFNVPGIAVGIIKDGKLVHAKGYGLTSLNTR